MNKIIGKVVSTKRLKVGDVISCGDFAFCERDSSGVLSFSWSVKACANGDKYVSDSLRNVKKDRAKSQYIVVSATDVPGGQEQCGGYSCSTGYFEFEVQKLGRNGKFNPRGERILFSPDNGVSHQIKKVLLIRRMKRKISFD